MNKIFNESLDSICIDYEKHVYPIVLNRLNFVIGVIAVRKGLLAPNDLNNSSFILDGKSYEIGVNANYKKTLVNFILNRKNKRTIKNGVIDFTPLKDVGNISRFLQKKLTNLQPYLYLNKYCKILITYELNRIKNKIHYLYQKFNKSNKQERRILNFIFEYPKFFHQKPKNLHYYGLILAQELDTPVCPYCNREYITSVKDITGKKVTGPTFDHFLSQAQYPFLALSFYNLIPCCSTCNSQLKLQIPFDLEYFLYPYKDSYEDLATFKLFQNKQVLKDKILNYKDLEIKILTVKSHMKYEKLCGPSPKVVRFKQGSINVFQTETVYNSAHINEAAELLVKYSEFPKKHIDSLFKSLIKDQGKTEEDVYRYYYGNYLYEKNFNKKPLARLTRDLTSQLNKIYGFKDLK